MRTRSAPAGADPLWSSTQNSFGPTDRRRPLKQLRMFSLQLNEGDLENLEWEGEEEWKEG